MRVGFLTIALVATSCGGDHKRPPLEEVPINEGAHDTVAADVPTAPSATASATTATPPSQSVATQAKALLQKGDKAGARALLEPRVDDKSATAEEKTLLKGICKTAHDTKCLAKLK
jgi:hypothetical protein